MSNSFVELDVVGHISTLGESTFKYYNAKHNGGYLAEEHIVSVGTPQRRMIPLAQISAVVPFNDLAESGAFNKPMHSSGADLANCVVVYFGAPSVMIEKKEYENVSETLSTSVQRGLIVKGTLADMKNKLNPVSPP